MEGHTKVNACAYFRIFFHHKTLHESAQMQKNKINKITNQLVNSIKEITTLNLWIITAL